MRADRQTGGQEDTFIIILGSTACGRVKNIGTARIACGAIDLKKKLFILVTFFTFLTFFIFKKRRQSSERQADKKHFQNNSNEIDL